MRLMKARLGFPGYSDNPKDPSRILDERLIQHGGYRQQDRMILDKKRTLLNTLYYSYQAGNVQKVSEEEIYRALINPDNLKQDYDDKIISIFFETGYKTGDVFKWLDTNTYWLICSQELTERAYYKGGIRKCNYTIKWKNEEGQTFSTFAAVRGPVETRIESLQKNKTSVDVPNHSLSILIPKTEEAYKYFQRYSKFYLQEDQHICWRVEAVNGISIPEIIEINATEYFINKDEDSEGVAGNLVVDTLPREGSGEILGASKIKPKCPTIYRFENGGNWSIVEAGKPVNIKVIDQFTIEVTWTSNFSGKFTLQCGEKTREIQVQSLI